MIIITTVLVEKKTEAATIQCFMMKNKETNKQEAENYMDIILGTITGDMNDHTY